MKFEIPFSLLLTSCLLLGTLLFSQTTTGDTTAFQETKSGLLTAEDSTGTVAEGLLFQMPVFIPDSTLTESMPVLVPPAVDQGMIIPMGKQH